MSETSMTWKEQRSKRDAKIVAQFLGGASIPDVARAQGVSQATVYLVLNAANVDTKARCVREAGIVMNSQQAANLTAAVSRASTKPPVMADIDDEIPF